MLGAVVAVTIDELKREIETLRGLRARARRLLDSGRESKFETLREVLEDPRYAGEKWLVFSEHRDTVDYLVRRLEGLGFSGQVAQIHGGMAWQEREEQVEFFRSPGGARYLVATDAAGEGINLQFCRLMVSYDIPWNPARLEQRMGRIHRYGQRHDVHIVNLVAGSTHEGRVLEVLLDKLDAIREELRSDKVFDVIGRLFENASLREYMIEALTDEGERRVRDRIASGLTGDRVRRIEEGDERAYGRGEGPSRRGRGAPRRTAARFSIASAISSFCPATCGASWRRARLCSISRSGEISTASSPSRHGARGLSIHSFRCLKAIRRRLGGVCAFAGRSRRRMRMRRACGCTPGEPVFDALSEWIMRAHAPRTRSGAASSSTRGRRLRTSSHLAQVHRGKRSRGAGRSSGTTWSGHWIDERVGHGEGVECERTPRVTTGDAAPELPRAQSRRAPNCWVCAKAARTALRSNVPSNTCSCCAGAPGVAPGAVPLASRALGMRTEAARYGRAACAGASRRRAPGCAPCRASGTAAPGRNRLRPSCRRAGRPPRQARQIGCRAGGRPERARRDQAGATDARGRQGTRTRPSRRRARFESSPGEVRFPSPMFSWCPRVTLRSRNVMTRSSRRSRCVSPSDGRRSAGATVEDVSKPERGAPRRPPRLARLRSARHRPLTVKSAASRSRAARAGEPSRWRRTSGSRRATWASATGCTSSSTVRLLHRASSGCAIPFGKLLANRHSSAAYTISAGSLLDAAEQT